MKLPSRKWIIEQITKNFWKRLSWLSFIVVIYLLGDEYLKEGYLFNPTDLVNPYSHETLAILLTIVAILSFLKHRFRGGGVAWVGVKQLKELQMNLLV